MLVVQLGRRKVQLNTCEAKHSRSGNDIPQRVPRARLFSVRGTFLDDRHGRGGRDWYGKNIFNEVGSGRYAGVSVFVSKGVVLVCQRV